jgi:thioredoxin 1
MNEIILTDQNFQREVLESPFPVFVDFFAVWCGPCQMMMPIIEELAQEYAGKLKIGKLDIDANPKTPEAYGIMSVPTFMAFKDGQIFCKSTGLQSKEELKARIKEKLGIE